MERVEQYTINVFLSFSLSHFVERTCRRLGVPNPMLSAAEARYPAVKWMTLVVRVYIFII